MEEVARVAGTPELVSDPRFLDRLARLRNRRELTTIPEGAFAARTTDEWWKLLNAARVLARLPDEFRKRRRSSSGR